MKNHAEQWAYIVRVVYEDPSRVIFEEKLHIRTFAILENDETFGIIRPFYIIPLGYVVAAFQETQL